jgi:hypothetical protein
MQPALVVVFRLLRQLDDQGRKFGVLIGRPVRRCLQDERNVSLAHRGEGHKATHRPSTEWAVLLPFGSCEVPHGAIGGWYHRCCRHTYRSVVNIPASAWYRRWQCIAHNPGLFASNATTTRAPGVTSTVSRTAPAKRLPSISTT